MNKGIKIILCATTAFALIAGFVTGCKVTNGERASSGDAAEETSAADDNSITVPVETTGETSETSEPKPGDYRSVKEYYNGEVPDKGVLGEYEFELSDQYSSPLMIKERGYYVDTLEEPDAPYFIVICAGEKNTGGYGIKITDIGLQDGELWITVEETSPAPGDIVTQAFTYPCCVLKLNKLPPKFYVIDNSGKVLSDVNSDGTVISNGNIDVDPRTLEKDYKLPDGWIASLRDGAGEIMYETFIYKDGTGYKYINIISVTESWGATKWNNKFQSEGTCSNKDEVLKAAKDFGSAGFLVLPDDLSKTYSVDDFIKMDL